ncbi:MAG: glycosyltransferase family 9 protein [candidate division Zixibacteria bacterium]|nr:glycosyltransferase family 9 protein [candidate division Zixibacteria bacterium]
MKKLNLAGTEKFLIVRTDRIGDLILSTPVAEVLKRNYPKSRVVMLVSPYTKDLLQNNPWVDEVITDDNTGFKGLLKSIKILREGKFDVVVLLRPTLRLAFLLFFSGIKVRIGTGYRAYQFLFNYKIYQHRKTIKKHELEYNLDMLAPLGVSFEKILPKIYLSPEEENYSRQIYDDLNIKRDDIKIVIHPGSGGSSLNYPLEKFAILADKLIEELSAKIILTGNKKELMQSEKMKSWMKHQPFDLTGKTELRQICSLLKGADLLISNSTGPMHIATAVGTPVVALFSPLQVASPKRWGPYGEENEVIMPPVYTCLKCEFQKCPQFNCMEKIDPDEIVLRVKKVLREKSLKVNG